MYATLSAPNVMGWKRLLRRLLGNSMYSDARLCQFAQCDQDAAAGTPGRPLCALHHSLVDELGAESAFRAGIRYRTSDI